MVPKLWIFNFAQNVAFLQFRGCWFQIWQHFFELTAQNIQIRQFWSQNWFCLFVCFAQFFFISAYSRVLIPNIAISFSYFHLKIPKRTFLVSNLRIYIFRRNFFKLTTQNYRNKACLVPKSKLFVLHDLYCHKFKGKIRILFTFLG